MTLLPLDITASGKPGVLELGREKLTAAITGHDPHPAMRARQIERWVVHGRATDLAAMSDLPARLRSSLANSVTPLTSTVARRSIATDGTHKLLVRLADGQMVETVLMFEEDRRTVCISTQVGCGMGCAFCASGLIGVARNLAAHEILEQLLLARNELLEDEKLTHVVVMGMGEPLANLSNLLAALAMATDPKGLGLSARHITISTVGLPARMLELADSGRKYHLAVSLHAPDDTLRTQLIPTNEKTGISAILDAAMEFFRKTGRQVTFEYILLGGVNDRAVDAEKLARLLEGRKAHVNLIPFNPVEGVPWQRPDRDAVVVFRQALEARHVTASVRKRKGADIDAACGQLRRQAIRESEHADSV